MPATLQAARLDGCKWRRRASCHQPALAEWRQHKSCARALQEGSDHKHYAIYFRPCRISQRRISRVQPGDRSLRESFVLSGVVRLISSRTRETAIRNAGTAYSNVFAASELV